MAGLRDNAHERGIPAASGRRILWQALACLFAVAVSAACGAPQDAGTAAPAPAPARTYFPAKRPVPVRLDMRSTADGGRVVAMPAAWRGDVRFDGGGQARCGIRRGEEPEIAPGASYEVQLVCSRAVQLPDEGRRGFRVLEEGREVASGLVLP